MNESGIVENLVTQFSSALDCFRELVQNSIDAGSPQVDVWMEYERGAGHQGVISIHVDDFGEGMDEAIIDNQLTQLFSSNKENDLTKIGKFGIGFVSVFALRPKGVLVHTGRGGEYWEVFFHEDRTFTKTQIPNPVEGTQLTLFLEGDFHRYRELARDVRQTLQHWCSHSETEVTFEDRSPIDDDWTEPEIINEPFEVPGTCITQVTHQGTEIVLAYTQKPMYGFYNRGLTLAFTRVGENVLDHRTRRYAHISFKIKSRYLEHTLSRETVMRDENYEKAMALIDNAASGPLFDALISEIEALITQTSWSHEQVYEYLGLMRYLHREPIKGLVSVAERRIFRRVDGTPATLQEMLDVYRRDGRLLFDDSDSEMARQLLKDGTPVFFGRSRHANNSASTALSITSAIFTKFAEAMLHKSAGELAKRAVGYLGLMSFAKLDVRISSSIVHPADVYLPIKLDPAIPDAAKHLIASAARILEQTGTGYRSLTTCQLSQRTTDPPLFVVSRKLSSLMAIPPISIAEKKRVRRPEAAVNRDHRQFQRLLKVHQRHPELAAYCLAKALLLSQDRLLDKDIALIQAARQN